MHHWDNSQKETTWMEVSSFINSSCSFVATSNTLDCISDLLLDNRQTIRELKEHVVLCQQGELDAVELIARLVAANGQVIASSSEGYESKEGAKNSIRFTRKNSPVATVEDKTV